MGRGWRGTEWYLNTGILVFSFVLQFSSPVLVRDALASSVSAPPPLGGSLGFHSLKLTCRQFEALWGSEWFVHHYFSSANRKCYPYKAMFDETVAWLVKFTVH